MRFENYRAMVWLAILIAWGGPLALAKDILALHSYRSGYEWTDELNRGFSDELAETPGVSLYFEFLDARRFGYPGNAPFFHDYLEKKYAGRTFDLILAADDEALDFLVHSGKGLWSAPPVVFCGVSSRESVSHLPRERFTGLIEVFNAGGLIATARKVRPQARDIYFITDNSTFGVSQLRLFQQAATAFPLAFHSLDGRTMSVEAIRDAVAGLPPDSILLLNSFRRDSRYVTPSQGDYLFAAASPVPVFAVAVARVSKGILMGTRNGGYEHGRTAAQLARRVLDGASPRDIPITDHEPPSVRFDYQELQRWQIPLRNLPPGAEIVNRPPSVWREYGYWIMAIFGVAIVQLLAIAALVINIIHRRRIQQQLRAALHSARQADMMKNRFIANISHELRTPMNGVLGLLQLLQRTPLNEEQRESATLAADSARSLLTVLNDLLDIAQIQDGTLKIIETPFSLRKLLAGICSLLSDRAKETDVSLRFEVEEGVPEVLSGDSDRLRQVVINLVSNALKFTPAGEVLIHAKALPHAAADPIMIRIEVRDTGIGIAPEAMNHIFEPFVQVDNSSARRFGGAGLGLAICRQLVTLMGGRIDGESKLGFGSLFWIELPFSRETALLPVSDPDACVPPRLEGRVILLVEDNAVNRLVARKILERTGCSVMQAADGQGCLDIVRSARVDLIVMDVQMPGMSGLEATRAIRQTETGGTRVPIVALTASSMEGDREECMAAGMDDYLSKPIKERDLLEAVRRWIPGAPHR